MNEHEERFVGDADDFEIESAREDSACAGCGRVDCANPIRGKDGKFEGCAGGGGGGGGGGTARESVTGATDLHARREALRKQFYAMNAVEQNSPRGRAIGDELLAVNTAIRNGGPPPPVAAAPAPVAEKPKARKPRAKKEPTEKPKARAPKAKDATGGQVFAKDMAAPLDRLAKNPTDAAAQRDVHNTVENLLDRHGLAAQARKPRSGVIEFGAPLPVGVAAQNHPDGRISMSARPGDLAPILSNAAAGKSFKAPKDSPIDPNHPASHLKALVHEQIHDRGPLTAYTGKGAIVEEIATEVVARKVMRDAFGSELDVPFALVAVRSGLTNAPLEAQSYYNDIDRAVRTVAEIKGDTAALRRVADIEAAGRRAEGTYAGRMGEVMQRKGLAGKDWDAMMADPDFSGLMAERMATYRESVRLASEAVRPHAEAVETAALAFKRQSGRTNTPEATVAAFAKHLGFDEAQAARFAAALGTNTDVNAAK